MMENQSPSKRLLKAWQICAGRNAAKLSMADLGRLAGVGVSTIERAESGNAYVGPEKLQAIRVALEAKGLAFTPQTIKFAKGR